MARRSTIGDNPLDAVIPGGPPPRRSAGQERRAAPPPRVAKDRITVHIPLTLVERLKNAVYWTPGLTLAGLAEEALERLIEELEEENGGPYPPRRHELRGGRPLK